jgi:hypothetical protein
MKPMRQVLLADGNLADGFPAREALTGGRFQSSRTSVESLPLWLKQVKSDPRTRIIPIVIMTSSKEERDLVAGYSLGVNSYIQKPVDFDQFRETVKTVGLYWLVTNQAPVADGARQLAEATHVPR